MALVISEAVDELRRAVRNGSWDRRAAAGVPGRRSTHAVRMVETQGGPLAIKVFRSCPRREAHREWDALTLFLRTRHRHAPAPVWCELHDELPAVGMTWVPGSPLGNAALSDRQLAALAGLLRDLYARVPPVQQTAGPVPILELIVERWPAGSAAWPDVVQAAHAAAGRWLTGGEMYALPEPSARVMGRGDFNLANFLWDGERLYHVDFEDSGTTDVASELADLVEHLESRRTPDDTWVDFVTEFGMGHRDRARHAACRRLFAVMWLLLLLPGGPAHRRNPRGTLERQAGRVLTMLG